jgi:hypothetical protein
MNNRPVASLGPTLLARKGSARPAMRPQVAPLRQFEDNAARQLDDLGWNDMGNDAEPATPTMIPAVQPERHVAEIVELNPGLELPAARQSEVLRQQAEIAERMGRPRRSALSDGRRAAFTLRLDAERHLKLRLACITTDRSAQQIVIEALDRLIADLPEVAELAAKVRKHRR